MITIDVKTKAVTNAREHAPQVYSKTYPRMNITPGYIRAWCEPNYPMPARLVTFEYWPEHQTDSGKPAVYGHDHYKPGRWLEFLAIE